MDSTFRMIDVGDKPVTHRVAVARGRIELSPEVCRAIAEKRVKKGDVLSLAEIAGVLAAKRTSDILPLCHPLPLESVRLHCALDLAASCVDVQCAVSCHGKTGVEMEALMGVNGALLCVYDLTKAIDRGARISSIELEHKAGGKSGTWTAGKVGSSDQVQNCSLKGLRAAVITVSDRCARGEAEDVSGKLLSSFLSASEAEIYETLIVGDEVEQIRAAVREMAIDQKLSLILLTGGTGLGPRDVTPEALAPLWTKTIPGFGECFRQAGMRNTPRAWLSRAEAGLIQGAVVVSLPGSPSAVCDAIEIFQDTFPHLFDISRGGGH